MKPQFLLHQRVAIYHRKPGLSHGSNPWLWLESRPIPRFMGVNMGKLIVTTWGSCLMDIDGYSKLTPSNSVRYRSYDYNILV